MQKAEFFCTCQERDCPFHPTNHNQGCTPCIEKNLKMGEIPGCFFRKVPGGEQCSSYTFKDFAEAVLKNT